MVAEQTAAVVALTPIAFHHRGLPLGAGGALEAAFLVDGWASSPQEGGRNSFSLK